MPERSNEFQSEQPSLKLGFKYTLSFSALMATYFTILAFAQLAIDNDYAPWLRHYKIFIHDVLGWSLLGIVMIPALLLIEVIIFLKRNIAGHFSISIGNNIRTYNTAMATPADLGELVRLGISQIGERHVPLEMLSELLKFCPKMVLCIFDEDRREHLLGYLILYPLKKQACIDTLSRKIVSAGDIEKKEYLCRSFRNATGIYIAMLSARTFFGKAATEKELLRQCENLFRGGRLKYVFTRAASSEGARLMRRAGFEPIGSPSLISVRMLDEKAFVRRPVPSRF
jgi:hypothetical protein